MLGFVTPRLFWDAEGTPQEEVDLEMQSCELGVGGVAPCVLWRAPFTLTHPVEAQDG